MILSSLVWLRKAVKKTGEPWLPVVMIKHAKACLQFHEGSYFFAERFFRGRLEPSDQWRLVGS